MGNPDHLKELRKGVGHWNAWREEQGEDFRPDFSETNIRKEFEDADLLNPLGRIPLDAADLRRADLREANLWGAGLEGANIRRADLRRAAL